MTSFSCGIVGAVKREAQICFHPVVPTNHSSVWTALSPRSKETKRSWRTTRDFTRDSIVNLRVYSFLIVRQVVEVMQLYAVSQIERFAPCDSYYDSLPDLLPSEGGTGKLLSWLTNIEVWYFPTPSPPVYTQPVVTFEGCSTVVQ